MADSISWENAASSAKTAYSTGRENANSRAFSSANTIPPYQANPDKKKPDQLIRPDNPFRYHRILSFDQFLLACFVATGRPHHVHPGRQICHAESFTLARRSRLRADSQ